MTKKEWLHDELFERLEYIRTVLVTHESNLLKELEDLEFKRQVNFGCGIEKISIHEMALEMEVLNCREAQRTLNEYVEACL